MPRLKSETFGTGDQSWLGSTHGIYDTRTETLNPAAFTKADHYPEGFIRSGQPVARVGGELVPYDAAAAAGTGPEVFAGFVYTDQATDGATRIAVPLLDHGRIKTDLLPVAFEPPTEANDNGQFVYITEGA